MAIKYSDETQVWKNGDVALAYEVMEKGFTEYILNSGGDVVARVEIPVLDGMFQVVASYVPIDGNFQVYSQAPSGGKTFYHDNSCLAVEDCRSREELEIFVRGKVEDYLYKLITERR